MTDSTTGTRVKILEAAAEIFGQVGYARATTRAIAAAAGVNEVTLFRHYGKKEKLLAAVIDHHANLPELTNRMKSQLTGEYRHDMIQLGTLFFQVILKRRTAVRLMLCEADQFPELRNVLVENPRQLRRVLAEYLQSQIDNGKVRPAPPELMAQAFWGMFFAYAIGLAILNEPILPDLSQEEIVAQFVELFVDGTAIAPQDGAQ